jgi:hypothetical protein
MSRKKTKTNPFSDIRQKTFEEMAASQAAPVPPEKESRSSRRKTAADQYADMVKEVLSDLREALEHTHAEINEGISGARKGAAFWTLGDHYSARYGTTYVSKNKDYAKVSLEFDEEDKPLHFICTRVRFLFDKHKKAGLDRKELIAALHALFAE